MSIVFFYILIINCFVIFAADALLGGLAPQSSQQQHTITINTGQPGEHLLLHASPRFIRELLTQQNQHPLFHSILNGGGHEEGQFVSTATKTIKSTRRYRRSASSSSEVIETILSEGGQSVETHKGKVKPRKGAPDFNVTPAPLPSSSALPSSTVAVTPTISISASNSSTNSTPSPTTLEKSSIPDATSPNTNISSENSSNSTNQSLKTHSTTGNITTTPIVSNSSSSITTPTNSSTPTGTTTTTTTTATTTTTTTTPPPPTTTTKPPEKKPKITYSILDDPTIENKSPETVYKPIKNSNVESVAAAAVAALASSSADSILNAPISQPSREILIDAPSTSNGRKYIIPIVALIFAIPMILTLAFALVRRFKSYWSTRHYRRMDFLIDGMYNT